jgi:hypothetical protein
MGKPFIFEQEAAVLKGFPLFGKGKKQTKIALILSKK